MTTSNSTGMQTQFFAGLQSGWFGVEQLLVEVEPGLSSGTGFLESATPFRLAGHFQHFFNQSAGFEFVELFNPLAKSVLCQTLDLVLVQFVFVSDFDDQIPLLDRTVPLVIVRRRGIAVTVTVAVPVRVGQI